LCRLIFEPSGDWLCHRSSGEADPPKRAACLELSGAGLSLAPGAGTWAFPLLPRLKLDSVMNTALLVETLQVRQQGRPRELHRFECWPQRSSHGRDHSGYRPCTLTPRPAPKSTTTLFAIAVSFLLSFLRKLGSEVLEKVVTATSERRTRQRRVRVGLSARTSALNDLACETPQKTMNNQARDSACASTLPLF
jgi:hypothetical protein